MGRWEISGNDLCALAQRDARLMLTMGHPQTVASVFKASVWSSRGLNFSFSLQWDHKACGLGAAGSGATLGNALAADRGRHTGQCTSCRQWRYYTAQCTNFLTPALDPGSEALTLNYNFVDHWQTAAASALKQGWWWFDDRCLSKQLFHQQAFTEHLPSNML